MTKHSYISWLMALGALLTLGASTVTAQLSTLLNTQIPFDFTLGGTRLPAGEYTIRLDTDDHMLLVEHTDGTHAVWVLASEHLREHRLERQDREFGLVFYKYDDEHYLREVWGYGPGRLDQRAHTIHENPLERKLANALRAAGREVESVRVP